MKLVFLIFINSFVFAAPAPLTMKEALKKGIDYSVEIKKAKSQIKGAEAETSKNRGSLFPTINGVGSFTNEQRSATFTTGSSSSLSSALNANTYKLGLTLSQPLYTSGLLTNGLSYYKSAEDIATQSYFSTKQSAVYNLVTGFYSLAQTQQLLDAAQSNKQVLKAYVDITTQYERIGRTRKMDQLQAKVNYTLSLADFETAQNNTKNALSNLNKLLGESNDRELKAQFQTVISPINKISLETAFGLALKDNPDIRSAQLKLEQVEYSEGIDLAADLPSLYLTGTGGYQSPDTANMFNSNSQYYSVGVSLTVPLFSGLSSLSKRSQYAEKKYQAEKDLQIAKDTLRANLENALHSLNSTKSQLDLAQTSVKEARVALDLANKAYKQGVASSQDVVNLQRTRYEAEKLFINSQFSYLQTLLQLRQYMGIDLEKAYAN
ncbi:MAG: TolC family protein [Oligoflexia bacterium]|nr:TolC family protein [Oligoflexia bacterium]